LGQSRQNDAIVAAMTSLCDGLDMCATAEGVETEAQLASLLRQGCHEAQGYLFSRPCQAEDLPALIAHMGVCAAWPQAAE
jgi:EAL domain-containing protein (putative c-di-GMP-specific phosphodiesterase class I)